MEKKAVLLGVLLVVAGMLGRIPERLVTGLGVFTLLHAIGLGLIAWGAFKSRAGIAAWAKSEQSHRYLAAAGAIAFLLLTLGLVYAVDGELEAGRHYSAVKKALDSPDAALELIPFVVVEETLPLKLKMIERIGETGNRSPRVTGALLTVLREDEREGIQAAVVPVIGKLLTPDAGLGMITAMPDLDPRDRAAYGKALEAWTGEKHASDTSSWASWLVTSWAGTGGEAGLKLALATYRAFPGDPDLRRAALDRVGELAAESPGEGARLASDPDPALRTAAATAIAAGTLKATAMEMEGILKKETDPGAARAQVKAIVKADPERADLLLLGVARTALKEAAKDAAREYLAAGSKIDEADPSALPALVFARMPKDASARRSLLEDLSRLAKRGAAARLALLAVARSPAEQDWARTSALKGLLRAEKALSDEDLVGLLGADPGPGLAKTVRSELRKRTGKDGGLDPKAWSRIIEEER